MNILAIESSCDETTAAVVTDGRRVRSSVVWSQLALHQEYGGVVPELAARAHVEAIIPVVWQALSEADVTWSDIGAIAVTNRPGLSGALLVGVNAAKGMALATGLPLIGVHHLEGHIAACWLTDADSDSDPIPLPATCLIVSGGHTELVQIAAPGDYELLGSTRDDAAGEAFDKGARLLGLGYPGGPVVQRTAEAGDPSRQPFPRAWLDDSLDFSFSGLKTALLRATKPWLLEAESPRPGSDTAFVAHEAARFAPDMPVADLAAGFQDAIVDVLVTKTVQAARANVSRSVLLVGGVAANRVLRDRLDQTVQTDLPGVQVVVPPFRFCTDNAAMIGAAGFWARDRGDVGNLWLDVLSRQPLAERES